MNIRFLRISCLLLLLLSGIGRGFGQESSVLEILNSTSLEGTRGMERLLGEVEMKHQSSLIFCDSAHFYRAENRARLFGNVRIQDIEDPITTTSAYAEYDGNTKVAKLRRNVVFTNQETTLYTDYLDYNRESNIATYFNKGRVVDSTNVLTSERGIYEVNIERITFRQDVVLVNPDYTMKTNDLIYLTIPKTAETKGLTNIISKAGYKLDAQKGSFYDTQQKQFRFFEGIVETEESRVKAEELFYDEEKAYYEGKEDVRVLNKERQVEVFGERGQYWEDRKYSLVHGNALVRKYFESDTLFMAADTLISHDSEADTAKYLLAFHSIKLTKTDLAGIADSLVYNYSDSSIRLFQDPVMWNQKSQISADSMVFFIANEELDRVYMKDKAFAIMTDTLLNHNQMKGRTMTGYFKEGQIETLDIDGNGESLYFALEADTLTQGINRILSANIKLTFQEGAIRKANFGIRPDGQFTPVQKIDEKISRLEGFQWRIEEKPDRTSIDAWRKPIEIDPDQENLFNEPDVRLEMPTEEQIQKKLGKPVLNPAKKKLIPDSGKVDF
ncbi:organic solvent tolerance protein OstA [Algoriphagus aestuariicola]|uniref:Organic solvent tolerance protein OstA n=1 Tax=Algoriphagus aestuariicola TaxID=1852016 RepID=A0ABS3BUN7_9BACT|nr:OstA-like protein [Algoriphagus aestuariicola]MBN7803004.1 organic solvent tolerance protein OstA [Algoriphagus aestuariicola]